MIQMAKSNLPSVESIKPGQERFLSPGETIVPVKTEGYASRKVDAKLTQKDAIKFRDIQRKLQDSGAKLNDGSFVSNRTKAIIYLIQKYQQ